MIKSLKKKPENHFEHLPDDYLWFKLFNRNYIYAFLGIQIIGSLCAIHLEIIKWNHFILKELKNDWLQVKDFCKCKGCLSIIASNSDLSDNRWPRFIKYFDFPYPSNVLISKQEL